MLKVVINARHGGFGLSDLAVERCIELGMKVTKYDEHGNHEDGTADFVKIDQPTISDPYRPTIRGSNYYHIDKWDSEGDKFRYNPILIKVVEELGEKANGRYANLKIIEIPFSDEKGWHVSEYDGFEEIEENHRSWGYIEGLK